MKQLQKLMFIPLLLGIVVTLVWTGCEEQSVIQREDMQPQSSELKAKAVADQSIEDQYIVVLKEGVEPSNVLSEHGLEARHKYRNALNGFALKVPNNRVLQALKNNKNVKYIEQDAVFRIFDQTLPTGVDRIETDKNVTAAIDNNDSELDVDIVILDTGIDEDHPDLNVAGGRNFSNGPDWKWDDGHGHGTHVAGISAAIDNAEGVVGVAPGARLWAAKVLDDRGSGYMSDIIAGIDWVTANAGEFEVANMSLGGTGYYQALREALQNSVAAGVVYVVAAGNDSKDVYGDDGDFGTDDDIIPAAFPEVAAISAMADSDGEPGGNGGSTSYGVDDSFASFSNYSRSVVLDNPVSSPGAAIDLILPGVDIYSTDKDGGYTTMSGTSMSSPHGAGLAALYIVANNASHGSASDVADIRQALIDAGVNQDSGDGLATLDDPDENPENLGWASSGAPSVSWTTPTEGDTVSGSVILEVNASDEDGSVSQVEFFVEGNSIGTDSDISDGWTITWDLESVSDGEHTLKAEATDDEGKTSSAAITVTVDNVDDAPTVSWVNPKNDESVSGTVNIQIAADDDRDIGSDLTVEWQVDDGTWHTASYNSSFGYYEDTWESANVSDGNHNLDARGTDTGGNISGEVRITVNVSNESAGGMYVWDIGFREIGLHLGVTVTVHYDSDGNGVAESSDNPVSDATVDLTLEHDSGDIQSYSGTTGSAGQVEFKWKQAPTGEYTAEVTDLIHDTYTWNSSLDADNPDYYTLE